MPSARVVEALDVVEHVGTGLVAVAVDLAGDPLGLQRGEEALHRRIVPDVSGPAHRAGDAVVGKKPLKLLTGVLRPLIGMMEKRVGLSTSPDRHHQRIHDQ